MTVSKIHQLVRAMYIRILNSDTKLSSLHIVISRFSCRLICSLQLASKSCLLANLFIDIIKSSSIFLFLDKDQEIVRITWTHFNMSLNESNYNFRTREQCPVQDVLRYDLSSSLAKSDHSVLRSWYRLMPSYLFFIVGVFHIYETCLCTIQSLIAVAITYSTMYPSHTKHTEKKSSKSRHFRNPRGPNVDIFPVF